MTMTDVEERARNSIEGGILGFHRLSNLATQPSFAKSAKGAETYDVSGNRYIDFVLGKGPIILGHSDPLVNDAVIDRIQDGSLLSITPVEQVVLAEQLLSMFDWCDTASFHKTGSDACSAAVRLARASTGHDLILSCGYHGWHDWCSPQSAGVCTPSDGFIDFGYSLDRLEQVIRECGGRVAAIMVEPLPDILEPDFYAELREAADRSGCWLIFDEVKSGFRTDNPSVEHQCGVKGDAVVLSKAIANGFCLSVLLGKSEFMRHLRSNHISSTMDIETVPYSAAIATLDVLQQDGTLSALCEKATHISSGLNRIFENTGLPAKAFALGSTFRIGFADNEIEDAFYSGCLNAGILLYPFDNQFVCLSHSQDLIEESLDVASRVCTELSSVFGRSQRQSEIADRPLWEFPNRKGFLRDFPGPRGR